MEIDGDIEKTYPLPEFIEDLRRFACSATIRNRTKLLIVAQQLCRIDSDSWTSCPMIN